MLMDDLTGGWSENQCRMVTDAPRPHRTEMRGLMSDATALFSRDGLNPETIAEN